MVHAAWDSGARITDALLRAKAGRYPHGRGLREFVGELFTVSDEFRTRWAAHDVRIHHGGVKRLHRPGAGFLELTHQPLDLPVSAHEALADPLHGWARHGVRGPAETPRRLGGDRARRSRGPPVRWIAERRSRLPGASRTRPDADGGRALLVRTIVGTSGRAGHA
ncbi:hypothetical protein ACIQU3_20320 [Streptomyces sp. NPDC101110]|uniref:MmyB family transcriptional regulator n=1 Tax=Streptomyces sp. NPDC101110 TaxID=3366104 RepID=UPI0037FF4FAE